MDVKQTVKFVPSGPLASWARNSTNVFGGQIFRGLMICQDLVSIGAKSTLIFPQGADYGI